MKRREPRQVENGSSADVIAAWGVFAAALLCFILMPLAL